MRGDRVRICLRAQLVVLLAILAGAACTEEPFSPSDRDSAPGTSAETREVTVPVEEFDEWRDTTYVGYALPVDASFSVAARSDSFDARVLARFPDLPDTVSFEDAEEEVNAFPGGELQIVLDEEQSRIPEIPFTLRFVTLERSFDVEDATWVEAEDGDPWSTPGGDLGVELGSLTLDAPSDSVIGDTIRIPLGAATDSVLRAWRESEGEPGSALLVESAEGADVRLQLVSLRLSADAAVAGEDTTVRVTDGGAIGAVPSTFIYDPPPADPGTDLRLGGLPAHRIYFVFEPPDSADGISLRGGTINRAELVFPSAGLPPAAYRMNGEMRIGAFELAIDPFVGGPKTPVGAVRTSDLSFDPTEGEDGVQLRLPVTALVQSWAASPADSVDAFWLGLGPRPDAASFGHWDFGSIDSDSLQRPSSVSWSHPRPRSTSREDLHATSRKASVTVDSPPLPNPRGFGALRARAGCRGSGGGPGG
ncbi:MAG: hypothetical protein ACOC9H_00440 [Gemmatimonadota bacterium]